MQEERERHRKSKAEREVLTKVGEDDLEGELVLERGMNTPLFPKRRRETLVLM